MALRLDLSLVVFALACSSDDTKDSAASGTTGTTDDDVVLVDSEGPEIPDPSVCDEEYSFCGTLVTPASFTGTPRSLALALYTSVPPAGPPNAILAEIPAPSIGPGERYPIRLAPIIETGDYYVWANLYMEGGGEWVPVNDIDYTGASAAPLTMSGDSITFDDISLEVASGW